MGIDERTTMLELNEKAAAAFNGQLAALESKFTPMPSLQNGSPRVDGDVHIVQRFGPEQIDIKTLRPRRTDYTGETRAFFFHSEDGMVGLDGEAHDTLVEITRRIAGDRAYRDSLSHDFVYDAFIDWMQQRTNEPSETQPEFCTYLRERALEAVRHQEIWFPIPTVQIPHPIGFAGVWFRRVTKEMVDDLGERLNVKATAANAFGFDRLRSEIQGSTAACVSVEAEPIHAERTAFERAHAAIAIFRLCCPTILNPYHWAPIEPSEFGGATLLHVHDKKIQKYSSRLPERMWGQWLIKPDDVKQHIRTVWGFGHNLLVIDRNEFQECLLSALIQYSRSVLKRDPSERLLYIVSALEALFIKDANENIGQNLRERLAVLTGPDPAKRLKRSETIKRVYELRSKFVHGALPLNDVAQLEDFFIDTWATFIFILQNYNKWKTKADFIRSLDEHKFTGPKFSTAHLPSV